jgi:aspartyl-tRNA(Asn)/glutamyl-tRNA(Gln) amidotransferase subunit C
MALTPDEVRKVALLARLELTDEEVERQMRHINELLERFQALQEVDVTGVEPTSHSFPVYNVLREDAARPSLPHRGVMRDR